VQEVYFTGAVTDPAKTDLVFAYRDADGRIRHYTPDFVIRARDDRWLLVEIKMTARREDPIEGREGLKARALAAQLAAQLVMEDESADLPELGEEEDLPEPLALADLDRPDLSQATDFSKLDGLRM